MCVALNIHHGTREQRNVSANRTLVSSSKASPQPQFALPTLSLSRGLAISLRVSRDGLDHPPSGGAYEHLLSD